MWRRVHGIFRDAGATNATWVWCPNAEYPGSTQLLSSLYPGDAYVDWTCVDGYNWGTDPAKPGGWKSLAVALGLTYDLITGTIALSQPFHALAEVSTQFGGSKASWLRSALLNELPARFPKLNAFLYFNQHPELGVPPGRLNPRPLRRGPSPKESPRGSTPETNSRRCAALRSGPWAAPPQPRVARLPVPAIGTGPGDWITLRRDGRVACGTTATTDFPPLFGHPSDTPPQ